MYGPMFIGMHVEPDNDLLLNTSFNLSPDIWKLFPKNSYRYASNMGNGARSSIQYDTIRCIYVGGGVDC